MTVIRRLGFSVDVPPGWEVEIVEQSGRRVACHFVNGRLPALRSDFGGHALEALVPGRVFLAVLEYERAEANSGLFQRVGIPRFLPNDFSPNHLHRFTQGQAGAQKFFSEGGRSFCAYAVVASTAASMGDVTRINQALRSIQIASIT